MGIFINFNDDDIAALDHACKRTGLCKTNLVRKLVHSYAGARLECLDLVSLKGQEYRAKKPAPKAAGTVRRG